MPDVEVEILEVGHDHFPLHSGRIVERLRPLRRFLVPLLVVAAIAAVVVVSDLNRGKPSGRVARPAPAPVPAPIVQAAAEAPYPVSRLVAPATVRAGEWVTVIGFTYGSGCEALSVRLDRMHIAHEVIGVAATTSPSWVGMFIAVEVPDEATAGPHMLELDGAIPGDGRGGQLCGDASEHRGRLGVATVEVVGDTNT